MGGEGQGKGREKGRGGEREEPAPFRKFLDCMVFLSRTICFCFYRELLFRIGLLLVA